MVLWIGSLASAALADATGLPTGETSPAENRAEKAKVLRVRPDEKAVGVLAADGQAPLDSAAYDPDAYARALQSATADAVAKIAKQSAGRLTREEVLSSLEVVGRPMAVRGGQFTVHARYNPDRPKQVPAAPPTNARAVAAAGASRPVAAIAPGAAQAYTGVVIDMTGQGFAPCMAPRIAWSGGRVLLDPATCAWDATNAREPVAFATSDHGIAVAARVGDHPLAIRGARRGAAPTDIVLPADAAQEFDRHPELGGLVRQGKVLVVTGPRDGK
jgi:hypothetical protein